MALSALSSTVASVPLDLRAVRASSASSLLKSPAGVNNPVSIPSVSSDAVSAAAGTEVSTQGNGSPGGKEGGSPKGGGGAGGAGQSESSLDDLIAAAKRKVQPQVGTAGADKVVGKDGSIDYKKLAELIAAQEAQKAASQQTSSSTQTTPGALLDLVS